jgi:hypothetical protein
VVLGTESLETDQAEFLFLPSASTIGSPAEAQYLEDVRDTDERDMDEKDKVILWTTETAAAYLAEE